MAEKYEKAMSRVHDLIAISSDDETMYCYFQVFHVKSDCELHMIISARSLGKCMSCGVTMHVRYSHSNGDRV